MAKFKILKPRVRNVRSRVPILNVDEELMRDPASLDRKAMYRSDQWQQLRKTMLERKCWYGCGRYALVLDHLVGHDDKQAASAALLLRVPILPHWQDRFWKGPFISLCTTCHNRKTWLEQRGRLHEWIKSQGRRVEPPPRED
jgi:hypothetical protein